MRSQNNMDDSKIRRFLKTIKYRLVLKLKPRQNRVYTQFYRFPNQYRALVDRVIPFQKGVDSPSDNKPLEIVAFACCNGAEPFTLSYVLQTHFPSLQFRIRGFDIVDDVIEKARSPIYTRNEIYQGDFVSDEHVEGIFDSINSMYQVKPEIAEPITFAVGDMLDRPFMNSLGKADLVFAQNVLFHLPTKKAHEAFGNLVGLLKPGSALFINGMDTDMRIKLTKRYDLQPLDYLVEEIHNDARVNHGAGWAGAYCGREPFSRKSREWVRKHCTIYNKAKV